METDLVSEVMLDFLDPNRTSFKISSDWTKSPDFSILFAERDEDEDIKEISKWYQIPAYLRWCFLCLIGLIVDQSFWVDWSWILQLLQVPVNKSNNPQDFSGSETKYLKLINRNKVYKLKLTFCLSDNSIASHSLEYNFNF